MLKAIKIWKYRLDTDKKENIINDLPTGHKLLHVGELDNKLYVWIILKFTTIGSTRNRKILIYGTGDKIEENPNLAHIGSVIMKTGLVWHVFEDTKW